MVSLEILRQNVFLIPAAISHPQPQPSIWSSKRVQEMRRRFLYPGIFCSHESQFRNFDRRTQLTGDLLKPGRDFADRIYTKKRDRLIHLLCGGQQQGSVTLDVGSDTERGAEEILIR